MPHANCKFRFGEFSLDTSTRELRRGEQSIDLQPKAFDVLAYLVENPDRVVSKTELLDQVWAGTVVTENVLSRIVSLLRKALGDDARSPRYIGLVPRVGYRLLQTVSTRPAEESRGPRHKRVAVLPFSPLEEERKDPALEVGMADVLISQLSCLRGIIVRPLASAEQLAGNVADPLAVGRALDANAVLHGSVLRRDRKLRVIASLLDVETGEVLWSQKFDETIADVFAVQDSICNRIIEALAPSLRSELHESPQTSPQAYRAYLEGRLYLNRRTQPDVETALTHFDQALDDDPAYAPAWAGVAECNEFFGTTGVDSARHYSLAKQASRRAISLDPDDPVAQVVRGNVAWQFDWDWARADRLLLAATKRYSNHAAVLIAYSDFCCYLSRADDGIEYARRALEVDPVSPWVNTLLAQALHMAGRDEEAIQQASRTLELAPGFPFAHFFRGIATTTSGRPGEALADLEVAVASGRPDFPAVYAMCLALAGREQDAREILAAIEAAGNDAPPIARALIYLVLGERDKTSQAFDDCVRMRDWHILLLQSEPLVAMAAEYASSLDIIERYMSPDAKGCA
jgi:DNA-binding winged helix-turn-helix (wHTH) protein/tetratricopeptide (TPR) repeat protein